MSNFYERLAEEKLRLYSQSSNNRNLGGYAGLSNERLLYELKLKCPAVYAIYKWTVAPLFGKDYYIAEIYGKDSVLGMVVYVPLYPEEDIDHRDACEGYVGTPDDIMPCEVGAIVVGEYKRVGPNGIWRDYKYDYLFDNFDEAYRIYKQLAREFIMKNAGRGEPAVFYGVCSCPLYSDLYELLKSNGFDLSIDPYAYYEELLREHSEFAVEDVLREL